MLAAGMNPDPFVPSVSTDVIANLSCTSLDFARDKRGWLMALPLQWETGA